MFYFILLCVYFTIVCFVTNYSVLFTEIFFSSVIYSIPFYFTLFCPLSYVHYNLVYFILASSVIIYSILFSLFFVFSKNI